MLFLGGAFLAPVSAPPSGVVGEDFVRESVASLRNRLIRLAIVD